MQRHGALGGPSVARFIAEHNPFYILSAVCMFLGIIALSDSFDWSPKPPGDVLALILTLNVYEATLIGLAVFLVRRGIFRDAVFLVVIEAFFLVDVGFLNMEIFTIDPVLGFLVNVALFFAAMLKVAVIFRVCNLPIVSGLFVYIMLLMLALLAIPGFLADAAMRSSGQLSEMSLYAAWWIAGLLPVMALVLARPVTSIAEFALLNRVGRIALPVLIVLPLVSLVAHLSMNHWVYKTDFSMACLSPLLLGLAVVCARSDTISPQVDLRRRLALSLPMAAIFFAGIAPADGLTADIGVIVSPLRLTLIGASIVCVDGWLNFRSWLFAWLGCGYLTATLLGPNVPAIIAMMTRRADETLDAVEMIQPRTSTHWGVLSIIASFVLLAIGAAISILKNSGRGSGDSNPPLAVEAIPPMTFEPNNGAAFPINPEN